VQVHSTEQEAILAFQRGDLARAKSLAEQQIAREPSAQLVHLMGLIECRGGRLEAGIAWLRRAVDEEPGNAGYRVMLARALVDAGRPAEAFDAAVAPRGDSPAELALWHARAEAADAIGNAQASVEAWGKLCSLGSADWRAWSNYANAATALGRWRNASAAFRRALELNPTEVTLRRSLATALSRAGEFQESADELGRWVEASPEDVITRIMFARLLADLGRDEEAQAQLDMAAQLAGHPAFDESSEVLIAIASKSSDAIQSGGLDLNLLRGLAQLLERSNRMDALAALLDELEARGVSRDQMGYAAAAAALREKRPDDARRFLLAQPPESDPVRWHWLMARIGDALDDPAMAFSEAEAMNRSVYDYDHWRARAAAHIKFLRDLASRIAPEWRTQLQTAAPDDRRMPAFLVGFPRSGTTLLDTFLMGHPDTHVFEEVPLIAVAQDALGDVADPLRSPADLARARDAYFAEAARYTEPGFDGLIVDKFPLNMVAAPIIQALFPGAPIIFAQRHPCDCVLSCFMQGFAMSDAMACFLDIHDSAAFYDAAMQVWTNSKNALPLKVHTIVYEDLIGDAEGSLRPLIDFLGLDWRDELLDHRATAVARGGIGTPSYNQVTQPLTRAAMGRWKRYEKQLQPVLPVLLPWAERLNYRD
jgi:tetratricopeptide (TPR) repeat protein